VDVHLIDGTYELFRHFYAVPSRKDAQGREVGAVRGVLGSVLGMINRGATHVGVATDHVIESFRNDLFPRYKSSAGMPPELLSQFPIVEDAIRALGLVVWPMVEFEADDAIAAACEKFVVDPAVEQVLICTPDKDMAQLVRGSKVVLLDRRRRITYDEPAVWEKWGVAPASIPDWLALVGDSSDGYPGLPGWGAKGAAAVLARYGSLDAIPEKASAWEVPSVRGGKAVSLAATLREGWDEVMLYRSLARLRTTDDGVEIPQRTVDELQWAGTPRTGWDAFCTNWGLPQLAGRPHRWAEG